MFYTISCQIRADITSIYNLKFINATIEFSRKDWLGISIQSSVITNLDDQLASVNYFKGPEQDKAMMTGLHTVSDIHCKSCMKTIGWTYIYAHNESEKYKEGKFIIEKSYMKLVGDKKQSSSNFCI
ncbi:UNKNOWN [Stylonychia lemnae]|uniref:Protein yippee-like n=1 Tax=Stylonychia lemnae TaxID=5949 RepID=A0A078AVP2_STYLE|nr:UNKNOWN [Stylonychia lemnae]|eukprot:CDW86254.1 UNKNOWN [Stylonychia lemnae]